jgi:hypothetical protein
VTSQGGTQGGGEDGGVGDGGVVDPSDSSCDLGQLQQAAIDGGGFVLCEMFVDGGSLGLPLVGEVVLDADGRVIDNTGLYGEAKQSWLSSLANDRWPCLAGQTIPYYCAKLY